MGTFLLITELSNHPPAPPFPKGVVFRASARLGLTFLGECCCGRGSSRSTLRLVPLLPCEVCGRLLGRSRGELDVCGCVAFPPAWRRLGELSPLMIDATSPWCLSGGDSLPRGETSGECWCVNSSLGRCCGLACSPVERTANYEVAIETLV